MAPRSRAGEKDSVEAAYSVLEHDRTIDLNVRRRHPPKPARHRRELMPSVEAGRTGRFAKTNLILLSATS